MDDKHIEDLLRDTLRVTPPEEMRNRTLRLARQELKKPKSPILGMSRWKAVLAVGGVAVIILTSISDSARQKRIDDMVLSPSESAVRAQIAQIGSLQEWESRQAEILDRLDEIEGTDTL